MKIKKRKFGLLSDGTKISLYTVSNKCMSFSVTNYGCTVTSIMVPDRNGNLDDIALGFAHFLPVCIPHNPVNVNLSKRDTWRMTGRSRGMPSF